MPNRAKNNKSRIKWLIGIIVSSALGSLFFIIFTGTCSILFPCEPEINISDYEPYVRIHEGEKATNFFTIKNLGDVSVTNCKVVWYAHSGSDAIVSNREFSLALGDSFTEQLSTHHHGVPGSKNTPVEIICGNISYDSVNVQIHVLKKFMDIGEPYALLP